MTVDLMMVVLWKNIHVHWGHVPSGGLPGPLGPIVDVGLDSPEEEKEPGKGAAGQGGGSQANVGVKNRGVSPVILFHRLGQRLRAEKEYSRGHSTRLVELGQQASGPGAQPSPSYLHQLAWQRTCGTACSPPLLVPIPHWPRE